MAFVMLMPGRVVGMYKMLPSFRGGMNSLPKRESGKKVMLKNSRAIKTVILGHFRTQTIMGL